jgi:hypothetical protein
MPKLALLLPTRERFGAQPLSQPLGRALGRADARTHASGEREQLRRHFRLLPDHWPVAALTRRADAGDAEGACWLRADPAHVRPDINGARLLACGDALALTREEADALLRPLKPVFGDTGFPIDAPSPGRWYLRMPREAKPPAFVEPSQALGADVFEHLPEGDAGRRWRALLSEAQVMLHNHPANAQRAGQGRPAVNSLWFWGGGVLPDSVATPHARLQSDDEIARALAHGVAAVEALSDRHATPAEDLLVDVRHARDLVALERDWLQPSLRDVASGALDALQLDFADGHVVDIVRGQRWRFWRSAVRRF